MSKQKFESVRKCLYANKGFNEIINQNYFYEFYEN